MCPNSCVNGLKEGKDLNSYSHSRMLGLDVVGGKEINEQIPNICRVEGPKDQRVGEEKRREE